MNVIIFESNAGHTENYARMLGESVNASVYSLQGAKRELNKGEKAFFMGWLCADSIKGYKKAKKRFDLCGVCAVGMTPTDKINLASLKKQNEIQDEPLFYLQGGMDPAKLTGIYKKMIGMVVSSLEKSEKNGTISEGDALRLPAMKSGYCCDDQEDLQHIINWWNE